MNLLHECTHGVRSVYSLKIEEPCRCILVSIKYYHLYGMTVGARGSVVVKALCYKPVGRGFETR
jgi:hypothetical protein